MVTVYNFILPVALRRVVDPQSVTEKAENSGGAIT